MRRNPSRGGLPDGIPLDGTHAAPVSCGIPLSDQKGPHNPDTMRIAPSGHAFTHLLHAEHILQDRREGASYGASCSRRLLVQAFAAPQTPPSASQIRGLHTVKSTFAHFLILMATTIKAREG
jgi:hypothetical protein